MKKNVLHIGTSGGRGSIESFIMNLCSNLDKDKYNFTIIADCEKSVIEQEFKNIGFNIIHIPSAVNNRKDYIKALWKVIDKNKYDVVHIHKNSLANPFPVFICKIKGIKKIILHSHNTQPANTGGNIKIHKLFRKIFNYFLITKIACSQEAAGWLFGKNYKKNHVLILKNGIDIDKFRYNAKKREIIRKKFSLNENSIAICNVGRLSEQKNTLFIINIFNIIHNKNNYAHLFLVGTGVLENDAKKLVEKLNLSENVHFLGIRNDVNEIYQGMDLFLMPSLHEGLPIAAVEAQAAGLPLLISDTVDKDVKICDSTEFEMLTSTAEKWAEHSLKLIAKTTRADKIKDITKAGYNIKNTAYIIDKIYCKD